MSKSLTLCFSKILAIVLFVGSGLLVQAQDHYLEILDGPNAGTKIRLGIGNFNTICAVPVPLGQELTALESADIYAGSADVGDMTGKVAIVRRGGSIPFDDKAFNVQQAGAIGMILINTDADGGDVILTGFGTAGVIANFWAVGTSYNDGGLILVDEDVIEEYTVRFTIEAVPGVFWYEEGQFAGGLGNWTTSGTCGGAGQDNSLAVFSWSPIGRTVGAYGGATIASPSACNGAIYFNSDKLDSDSISPGSGPCSVVQLVEVVSPTIDLLSIVSDDQALALEFYQALRQYQSNYFVEWSSDGGVTWTSKEINSTYPVNSPHIQEKVNVLLEGLVPTSNFKFRFRIEGNYYYWIIDDVRIIEPFKTDLKVDEKWYAAPFYPMTPKDQSPVNRFMTDIKNQGSQKAENSQLSVVVTDANGAEVYSAVENVGTINPGDTVQNIIFGEFKVPEQVGTYTITYTASCDEEDEFPSNNTIVTNVESTEYLWARETGSTSGLSLAFTGTRHNYAWGNAYRGEQSGKNDIIEGQFSIANPAQVAEAGGAVTVYLLECEDSDGDMFFNPDLGEYTIRGYIIPELAGLANYEIVSQPFIDYEDGETELRLAVEEGKYYIVLIQYLASLANPEQYCYMACSYEYKQQASDYASLEGTGTPRPAGILVTAGFDESNLQSINASNAKPQFADDPIPVARLVLGEQLSTKNTEKLSDNQLTVFPTNVQEVLNVKFNLTTAADALLEVFDAKGTKMFAGKYSNMLDQTETINVSNYAPGSYFVNVKTSNGVITKPFNVIK